MLLFREDWWRADDFAGDVEWNMESLPKSKGAALYVEKISGEKGIVICSQLLKNPKLLEELKLSRRKYNGLMAELSAICLG